MWIIVWDWNVRYPYGEFLWINKWIGMRLDIFHNCGMAGAYQGGSGPPPKKFEP